MSSSLLSANKNTDSRLSVQLHPLAILTISDHVTRHVVRQQYSPIVGAVLGAQNGREITMEHAFECKVDVVDGETLVDQTWFHDRLQQYRDVHKVPALELVAWFTLTPETGPQPAILPIHQQLLQTHNESLLLLALHPAAAVDSGTRTGKLPLTIYETVYEAPLADGDKHMQDSAESPSLLIKFQEIPYSIETGQAEMIGVDFVAKGGVTSARAAAKPKNHSKAASPKDGKGKTKETRAGASDNSITRDVDVLSVEDDELIASLTTRANAVRMLQNRISLLKTYLTSMPPCYLNMPVNQSSATTPITADPAISHTILRSIASLVARLPLLTPLQPTPMPEQVTMTNGTTSSSSLTATPSQPRGTSSYALESQHQRTDVALVALIGSLGSTLQAAQSLGRKSGVVEHAKNAASRNRNPRGTDAINAGFGSANGNSFSRLGAVGLDDGGESPEDSSKSPVW